MALTGPAKLTIAVIVIGGVIACFTLIPSKSVNHPANIQKLLDWEKNNGGCKIFMAVKYDSGKLYRPGDERKTEITDDLIDKLGSALYTGESKDSHKTNCEGKKGKALVFANKSGWVVDTQEWKNKGGDVAKYSELFKD